MKAYQNFFEIASDVEVYPYPTMEDTLKFASQQILGGYRNETEALEEAEILDETGNCRFSGYGHPFGANDIRVAIELNNQYGWGLIKKQ